MPFKDQKEAWATDFVKILKNTYTIHEILVDEEIRKRAILDIKKEISERMAAIKEQKDELVILRNTLKVLKLPRKEREKIAREKKYFAK